MLALICNFVLGWPSSGSLKRTGSWMNSEKFDKSFSCMIVVVLIVSLSEGI